MTCVILALSGFIVWGQRHEIYTLAKINVLNTGDVAANEIESKFSEIDFLLKTLERVMNSPQPTEAEVFS